MLGVRSRMNATLLSYTADQFDEICTSCQEIRQLGITFPATSVSYADQSAEFTSFLVRNSISIPV